MGLFKKIGSKREEKKEETVKKEDIKENELDPLSMDDFDDFTKSSSVAYEKIKHLFERCANDLDSILHHYNKMVQGGAVFTHEQHVSMHKLTSSLAKKLELFHELNEFDAKETSRINNYYDSVAKKREELLGKHKEVEKPKSADKGKEESKEEDSKDKKK